MITAHKTNIGASKQDYAMTNGFALEIVGFCIGDGGHNPLNGNPITVDRNVSSLPGLKYKVDNSEAVSVSVIDKTSIQVECSLRAGEAVGIDYSNLGLFAKVVDDSTEPKESFLYAIANFSKMTREEGSLKFIVKIYN